MKTSLKKLRGFALHHRHGVDHKDRRDLRSLAQLDELAQASQDMEDMRDCYDTLLSAAAATANSAYEFSESLHEMGACLLQKTALHDDEESGRVLLMLGKVQFELQKLIDSYRSHIFQTITSPSESLLNELRIVEGEVGFWALNVLFYVLVFSLPLLYRLEMKQQCDEKRVIYENMLVAQRTKGRGKSGKGESFSTQQIQAAHDEYDEEATLFVFRLKSLKQGQSRSLLTQAARHHAAQLCFFRKALKCLAAVEPEVKLITEAQHIDYQFRGLEDDDRDDGDDDGDDDSEDAHDGELSFDYGQTDHDQEVSISGNSMEVDVTFPQVATSGPWKENVDISCRQSFSFDGDVRAGSQSAPLFAESKTDPADKLKLMRTTFSRKFSTYVLPTPVNAKSSNITESGSLAPPSLKSSLSVDKQNVRHSFPPEPKKSEKRLGDEKFNQLNVVSSQSVLRESNSNTASTRLPPPLADRFLSSHLETWTASDPKKVKRYAFSGPIPRNPWPTNPIPVKPPHLKSGPLLQTPVFQFPSSPKASPKVSPTVSPRASRSPSPTFASSPKISELHELPRPPVATASKSSRPLGLVGHSAPLMPKGNMHPAVTKPLVPNTASPLPTPSQVVTRSFSIPSRDLRAKPLNVSKKLEASHIAQIEEVSSPP
ncbi:hypothetical protein Tsubulata_024963 [Turnera subulata]|uniref:BAR domain-containing protein n=1 Tax=Turnera subulata TaxID=218843 RepID=A0A9Q0FZ64_9ROSI|nr:hypothetical protein Tsubulata_024963 [Turnera subulata]